MSGGKRLAGSKTAKKPDLSQFSKWMIADIRPLLWVVTVGGLLLAAYCIRVGYTGSLPWISAMVGLPCGMQFLSQYGEIRSHRRWNHI